MKASQKLQLRLGNSLAVFTLGTAAVLTAGEVRLFMGIFAGLLSAAQLVLDKDKGEVPNIDQLLKELHKVQKSLNDFMKKAAHKAEVVDGCSKLYLGVTEILNELSNKKKLKPNRARAISGSIIAFGAQLEELKKKI